MKTNAALLFAGTASATFSGWTNAPTYKTPSNNNNECNSQEKSGFDWSNLNPGSFDSYGSYSFSGFQCSSTFGKRDTLTKRTFGAKVIEGSMSAGSGPSFSCGADKDFSISEYQVSVSKDTDVEFHYQMEDGSTCKQTTSCKSGGTIVQNSQCGGAKQVQFQLPQGSKGGCDIGIHSIGFDCSPPVSSVPPPKASSSSTPLSQPASSPAVPTSAPAVSTSSSTLPISTPALPTTISKPVPNVQTSSHSSTPVVCTNGGSGPKCSVSSTPVSPVTSSSSTRIPEPSSTPVCEYRNGTSTGRDEGSYGSACSAPAVHTSSVPVPAVPSSSAPIPVVPVPNVPASSSTPVSPVTTSSFSSSKGVPALTSVSSARNSSTSLKTSALPSSILKPSSTNPSIPVTTAPCPDVVPQCLNTWIGQTGCKDNSDHQCYCAKADFTKNVMECITAHGADKSEVQKALTYLVGICAAQIPQNPGLITNCPSSIPLTAAGAHSSSIPATTPVSPIQSAPIPIASTVTEVVVTSYSSCSIGQTVTAAGKTTVLQTPSISTITMTSTSIVPCSKCAAATAPPAAAVTQPAAVPMTTITIAQSYTVPMTYATGPSAGFPIPSSSTVTMLSTAITVPQVAFTTLPAAAGATAAAVGLAPVASVVPGSSAPAAGTPVPAVGTPASACGSAASSAAATNGIFTAAGVSSYTGFGTSYLPTSTSTGGPLQVTTNAAVKMGGSVAGLFAGAVVAVMAL
ncbi:hypothetical protein EG328_001177 [Venturia inaequalis]|uniref:CFEM domain-containing protein n=1 Tax=Venturia inaequalis TaxID=5025 RepID=A0A8H3U499_VENIN|nr:hypothetical protein EG328_001177 [Venturia inaequalis]